MATIGRITVPTIPVVGTFPFTTGYPHGTVDSPQVWVHDFASGNHKISQRFLRGTGARIHTFQRQLSIADIDTLKTFWEARNGAFEPFSYDAFLDGHSGSPTTLTVRFLDPAITFDQFTQAIAAVGINFIEEVTTGPTHAVSKTLTRFPDAALETALESQVQELIPLIKIRVREAAVDDIFLSDRTATIGGQLYQPRLIRWTEITQGINGESDSATFEFGNADRVMVDLMNDTNLLNATVEFSLFHVSETTKVDLWAGEIVDARANAGPIFSVQCGDSLRQLSLEYPTRRFTRECWKTFDDGNACPYTAEGLGGDPVFCDKGFATTKGCTSHGMDDRFGGVKVDPQTVRVKDNSKGFFGIGRPTITAASITSDSVYGRALPQHYTDVDMLIPCDIVTGSDEGDFYAAVAVVGEGPIGSYGATDGTKHKLDNQPHHGAGESPPTLNGLELSLGADPNADEFSIGPSYTDDRAAGTAFIEIRRTDSEGQQLSQLTEHTVEATVATGLKGFTWTGVGSRTSGVTLTNPVWVLVNALIQVNQLQFGTVAAQEALFDVAEAVAAAAICDTVVTKEVGSGTQKQYRFIGSLRQRKPFRDWAVEILNNCLGYFTFSFGKLKIGIRNDSSVVEAYTTGNIILDSLEFSLVTPTFNWLVSHFGNENSKFGADSVTFYEETHALNVTGIPGNPKYETKDLNLVGTSTRDQAFRIVVVRLREEVGGISLANFRDHRDFSFRSTVLSLDTDPGQIISITHDDAPGGVIEGRVRSWTLHEDFSITISGRTTVDAMYDLTTGPKPDDVEPDAVPAEVVADLAPPPVTSFAASEDAFVEQDGTVRSDVTVTYTEPSPLGTFKGVAIFLARLDTDAVDGSGVIEEEPHEITRIPQDASPSLRRFLLDTIPVVAATSGAVRLWAVSFSDATTNAITGSPTDDVLLDGKDSAPTAVADLWCQTGIKDGLRLRWDRNPERDLGGYRIADTGDVVPASDSDIAQAQVIATMTPDPSADHEQFDFMETLYRGTSDGTIVTLGKDATEQADAAAKFFPASAHVVGGVGKNVQFIESDGSVTNIQVVSNTERTITFAAAAAPTGQVKFYVRGSTGGHNLYVQPFDTSGNSGLWAPTPPTVLACTPLAIDGSKDIAPPTAPWVGGGGPVPGTSFFSVHPAGSLVNPGEVFVQLVIRSTTESEADFDLANKHSINGINRAEVEITHSDDGVTGLGTTLFARELSNPRERYQWVAGPPFDFWDVSLSVGSIALPNQGITQIRARVQNSIGWSDWSIIGIAAPPGSSPVFTGGVTTQAMLTVAVDPVVANTFVPNLAKTFSFKIDDPAADFTIKKPNYRASGGLDATGDTPTGIEIIEITHLNGAVARVASFDSEYKGVDSTHYISSPFVNGWVTWRFKIESATFFRIINYFHHNPTA